MASSVVQDKRLDETTLVDQLNYLLRSIDLPISLISPTDLTPGILMAILESILGMRISLVDRNKETKNSRHAKVQNMKIFLGVMETDILNSNVDLSDIDPRRLADGEWEEVYYIGELLCWIGRKLGLIGKPSRLEPLESIQPSSVTALTAGSSKLSGLPQSTKSQLDLEAEFLFQGGSIIGGSTRQSHGTLSPFLDITSESETSLFVSNFAESDGEHDHSDGLSDILGGLSPFKRPESIPARCIHEVSSPFDSLLLSTDLTQQTASHNLSHDLYSSPPLDSHPLRNYDASIDDFFPAISDHGDNHSDNRYNSSVRYSGFIEPVNENSELESFELSRSIQLSQKSTKKKTPTTQIDSVRSQYTRTLELLNERARLLTQLAELKNMNRSAME